MASQMPMSMTSLGLRKPDANEVSATANKMPHPPHRGPVTEKMPLPAFVKRELHDKGQCEPCVFKHKAGGCWYGDQCRYCHMCTPEEVRKKQSRRFYMERALRKERVFQSGPGAP